MNKKRLLAILTAVLVLLIAVVVVLNSCQRGDSEPTPTTATTEATTDATIPSTEAATEPEETTASTEAPTEAPTEPEETEKPGETEHKHDYKSEVTAPTCTEMGYTTYTCSCGDAYKDTETKATGHDYKKTVVAPTKTAQGYTLYECKNCDYSYKDNYTDKLPSDDATEPVHQHSYKSKVTAPTCTAKGYTTYTCDCGHSYKGDEKPALGHNWDNGKVTKKATCSAEGVKTYTCKRNGCGKTKTETIAKTAHDYKNTVVAPTCTEKGYTLHECKNCPAEYKDAETKATGHSYTSKVTKEATCTAKGVKTYTCGNCKDSYTEDIAAKGHSWGKWVVTKEPTTTSEGVETRTCSRSGCGATETRKIDKLPAETEPPHQHSYTSKVTKAATCTENGVKTFTCSCGDSYTETIAKTGHSWGDWVRTKEPTTEAEGQETRTCSTCGATETRAVEKLPSNECTNHSWGNWTSDDNGSYRSCTACGEQQVIDGAGSHYSKSVVDIINQYRAAEGLDPVTNFTWKIMLVRAHELTVCFSHSRPDGSYGYDTCIAAGYGSAQTAVDAWMNSSSHRGSLMNPNATEACAAYNGSYWVLYIG